MERAIGTAKGPALPFPSPDTRPIGLLDSGVGGLTVWREVARALPNEDLLYFADQAHCPYGARPLREVRELTHRAAAFLLDRGAKLIVLACNTASAAALDSLRTAWPQTPFVGMEPAIKPAAAKTRTHKVGILATRGTLEGDLFARTRERVPNGVSVIQLTGDGLVEQVETGEIDSPAAEALVRRYVEPLRDAGVDEIVLGCTHYPFLAPLIQRIVGPSVALVDAGPAVARQVERVIIQRSLSNEGSHRGEYHFFTSGEPEALARVMDRLIGVKASVEPVG